MGQVSSVCKDCQEGKMIPKAGAVEEPWEAVQTQPTSADETTKTSIDIYPARVHGNPPVSFSSTVDDACAEIHGAVKGWGTDEKALIRALASRSPAERYEICVRYEEAHGRALRDVMKSECGSGNMGLALQLLALPADAAEALLIREAARGVGVRERRIYPVLCGRSNAEMALLREAYFAAYEEDIAVRLDDELGGDFKRFVMRCLQGSEQTYEAEYHTPARAEADAQALYEAGQGRWGTNEKGIFKIICRSPPPHLANVDRVYSKKHGKSVLEALDSELGGDVERACVYAAGMKLQPYRTIARQIRLACRGFGTDEMALTSLIVRYQTILADVDRAHKEMYEGKSLADRVEDETSGLYKHLLLEVIKAAV